MQLFHKLLPIPLFREVSLKFFFLLNNWSALKLVQTYKLISLHKNRKHLG
nr:MAG TPA: hypothetical protein [Caudoviricetes sp.]